MAGMSMTLASMLSRPRIWYALTEGIERPDHRSYPHVLRLAEAMGVSDWTRLWEEALFRPRPPSPHDELSELYAVKMLALYDDEAWRPYITKAIDHLWQERERSTSESFSAAEVDGEQKSEGG